MYYSITFTNSNNETRNTWSDWHLVPTTPPMVDPPEPYINIVEVPGRHLGPIDLTEVLTGEPTFNNSQGSWSFISAIDTENRMELYLELKKFLHGQRMQIKFEEDPFHYYEGRITVERPQTGKGHNQYSLKYTISPVRYYLDGTQENF